MGSGWQFQSPCFFLGVWSKLAQDCRPFGGLPWGVQDFPPGRWPPHAHLVPALWAKALAGCSSRPVHGEAQWIGIRRPTPGTVLSPLCLVTPLVLRVADQRAMKVPLALSFPEWGEDSRDDRKLCSSRKPPTWVRQRPPSWPCALFQFLGP